LTAVNPPALTGVKPDEVGGRGDSLGTGGADSRWILAFRAAEALMAGESVPLFAGVAWADFFIGEGPGEGV
jgi:hypothetical protein